MKLNRKFLINLVAIFAILGASNYANATTQHDNEICFKDATVTNFVLRDHSVTKGQPYNGVDSKNGCIHVYAGRKGDYSNVSFVKVRMANNWNESNALVSDNSEALPEELNFAIYGHLEFVMKNVSYTCENILIGQGHAGLSNKWWFFSNNNDQKQSITCTDHNNNVVPLYYYNDTGGTLGNTYFRFSKEPNDRSKNNVVRVG